MLGYIFHWQKIDAQFYLVRQRRERIWGIADLKSEVDPKDFSNRIKRTLESMASTEHFEYEKCFDHDIPKMKLKSKVPKQKLEQAISKVRLSGDDTDNPDVFIDCSTSMQRAPEFAVGVATCVRPSHQIYSNRLGRYLSVSELWACQGLFKESFANPKAVDDVMANQTQAQDLAGLGLQKGKSKI